MEQRENSEKRPETGGPPRIKGKVVISHDLEGTPFSTPLLASCREDEHGKKGTISLDELGAPKEYQENTESRYLWIARQTGFPAFEDHPKLEATRTVIQGKMLSYSLFSDEETGLMMIAIGCEHKTHYVINIPGSRPFRMVANAPAYHSRHAVRELLQQALYRGPKPYGRLANLVPAFFKRAIGAVYDRRTILPLRAFTLKGRNEGESLGARLYLTPGNFKATILSVDGWCFDYDLNHYPLNQQIAVEKYNEEAKTRKRAIANSKKKRKESVKQAVAV